MQTHSSNEFRTAWNNHCDTHSFNAISDPIPSATVGEQYFGSDFDTDGANLIQAIQSDTSIQATTCPALARETMLAEVLTPSEWGF